MEPDERAQAGVFMAFQYPVEIPGVSIANFLRTALQSRLEDGEELDLFDFQELLMERMELLEMDVAFAQRPVNDGFSGGEKKRNEILQMAVLRPSLAVMDETDSGLDIDALKVVAHGVNTLKERKPGDVRAPDHPLPAHPEPHRPGPGPRHGGREDRGVGRPRGRAGARGAGIRGIPEGPRGLTAHM